VRLITSAELARQLGTTQTTVARHCRRLGLAKTATVWVLSPEQADRVRASINEAKPGFQPGNYFGGTLRRSQKSLLTPVKGSV
jgi:hypothetical protein